MPLTQSLDSFRCHRRLGTAAGNEAAVAAVSPHCHLRSDRARRAATNLNQSYQGNGNARTKRVVRVTEDFDRFVRRERNRRQNHFVLTKIMQAHS
ncbi:hypothetical protein D3C87_1528480 [compost metagenome]